MSDGRARLREKSSERPLQIPTDGERQINAQAFKTGDPIPIHPATSQLFGDEEGELAYLVAHQLKRILRFRNGRDLFSRNDELDADPWAAPVRPTGGYAP